MALGWSKQNWVANFQNAGLEWATRHGCLGAYSEHRAKDCNKSNPIVRLQAEIRAGDAAADRVPERGHSGWCHSEALEDHREWFAQKTRLRLTILPVLKRTRPLSLEPNSPKGENHTEGLNVLGCGKVPKCSQAAPSLVLAELNKICHLTGSQKFILKS